jgi:carbonic anhydrase
MLRKAAQSAGDDIDSRRDLIIMQHTQCGITRIQDHPELLAPYFQISESDPGASVGDPRAAAGRDAAIPRAYTRLTGARVPRLVNDVGTGLAETIAQP